MRNRRLLIMAAITLALPLTSLITSSRAAAQTETVLHSFSSSEGISPALGLIFDSAGNLYGVAAEGGGSNAGTIFELMPSGSSWTEKTLYKFKGSTDGAEPVGSLIFDKSGNLYGTTKLGGTNGVGTAFELSLSGGTWTKKILHNFGGSKDGQFPTGALVLDVSGNLYGTTEGGGSNGNGQENSGGTAYRLAQTSGTWTETVIHSFGSGTDGAVPRANLILDTAGNLYGTTIQGGANTWGTVFEVSPGSGGGWTEKILYSFNPVAIFTDGAQPVAGLIFDKLGNLYGTTTFGGELGGGTVFELSPKSGGTWTEAVLFAFEQPFYQPSAPYAGLVFDTAGNLYGATLRGSGPTNQTRFDGTVFKLTPSGGTWNSTTLYGFDGTHGAVPSLGSLIFDSSGNLYGGTQSGGDHNDGVVFKITP
jgi:uncharacterized repeat protein (TIGR03803 family)